MHKKCLEAYLKYTVSRPTEGVRGATACFIKRWNISYIFINVTGFGACYLISCSISWWKYMLFDNSRCHDLTDTV